MRQRTCSIVVSVTGGDVLYLDAMIEIISATRRIVIKHQGEVMLQPIKATVPMKNNRYFVVLINSGNEVKAEGVLTFSLH